MRQFISRGYLVLQTDFPKEFHESLNAKLSEVMEGKATQATTFCRG